MNVGVSKASLNLIIINPYGLIDCIFPLKNFLADGFSKDFVLIVVF